MVHKAWKCADRRSDKEMSLKFSSQDKFVTDNMFARCALVAPRFAAHAVLWMHSWFGADQRAADTPVTLLMMNFHEKHLPSQNVRPCLVEVCLIGEKFLP